MQREGVRNQPPLKNDQKMSNTKLTKKRSIWEKRYSTGFKVCKTPGLKIIFIFQRSCGRPLSLTPILWLEQLYPSNTTNLFFEKSELYITSAVVCTHKIHEPRVYLGYDDDAIT